MALQANYQGALEGYGNIQNVEEVVKCLKLNQERGGKKIFEKLQHDIVFNNVSFNYKNKPELLKNVNLTIKKNTVIGFTGESGSGKSSLLNLLVLLNSPEKGEIYIDGQNISDFDLQSLRSKIGYVIQESHIFNDTLVNNISLWDQKQSSNKIVLEKARSASNAARILDFIETLKDGFETVIEGNGSALSGGQRQRIIVAREIYKNPEIIILDEASSALDGKNEANLFSEILNLRQNRIIIVVAHKISKPEMFDQLYEIKNCELIQIK